MLPSMELKNEAAPYKAQNGVRVSRSGVGRTLDREYRPHRNRFRLHPEGEDPPLGLPEDLAGAKDETLTRTTEPCLTRGTW